ncbi:dTDP-4-dehydrorhamnose 3,5-epimerase [Lentimicrobium saccharophilum]|uniref:dTDP-4-dehydrorhamnose 3,5-epimerase n=1 Tax=Lentimicrobium saccharophilum TaxID=1678841 RepID=A0A0S7BPM4_9BACT|nr:dTDP-4-dehydrorhamnose 3,5-epimerase [Lentimicrobium saccharophilum]GAP42348.1 dTDP-4-dehydrorhamnose 3,5-epimerase [Lentimicrobium saccharophilum]
MEISKRKLEGVFEINLNPLRDQRGFFMRAYDLDFFESNGLHRQWVQENHSRTDIKGTIRGLHFQLPPFSETKLVRCIQGAILDVFVDLRKNSTTFGQWDALELSEDNARMVFIPRGFAHGFCTLTQHSQVLYKVDNFYSRENERGLLWSDPEIGIEWPVKDPFLSEKDRRNMTFGEFLNEIGGLRID